MFHYIKVTVQLRLKLGFQKVVNPRHQTPQGQSDANPGTPL